MTVYVNGNLSNYLTTEVDTVTVTGKGVDTVYGNLTSDVADPLNTLNPNDSIAGNGETVLKLNLSDLDTMTMPSVDVSGVRVLDIKNLTDPGAAKVVSLDATNWGTDLERFALSGSGHLELEVKNATLGSELTAVAMGANQDIDIIAATFGSSTLEVDVENVSNDAVNAKVFVGEKNVRAWGGAGDTATVTETSKSTSGLAMNELKALGGNGGASSVTLDWLAGTTGIGSSTIKTISVEGQTADVNVIEEAKLGAYGTSVGAFSVEAVNLSGAADLDTKIVLNANTIVGDATVGNVDIGPTTVTLSAGGGASSDIVLDVDATSNSPISIASVGAVTIKKVDASSIAGSLADIITIDADGGLGSGTVGAVKLGNVIAATSAGSLTVDLEINTKGAGGVNADQNDIAALTLGKVSLNATDGDALYVVKAGASKGDLGNVQSSGISLDAAGAGADAGLIMSFVADKTVGNVKLGNLSVASGLDSNSVAGSIDQFSVNVAGSSVGNVKLGNVEVDSAANFTSTGFAGLKVASATGDIGTVKVGDIDLDGAIGGTWSKHVLLDVHAYANLGAATVGDVEIDANAGNDIQIDADYVSDRGNAGGLAIGDLDLNAMGSGGKAIVSFNLSAMGNPGELSTGDIDLTGYTAAVGTATVNVELTNSLNGNVKVGDIDASSVGTATGNATFNVALTTTGTGNITIGDVTVNGTGGVTDDLNKIDSTGSKGWIDASVSTGTVTIGDIDYSAYAGSSTIDVSKWTGAANIDGSLGGSEITGNKGQNTYDLEDAGAAADRINFVEVQDNGLSKTGADYVQNFKGGADSFYITTTDNTNTATVDNTGVFSFDAFINDANTAMTAATGDCAAYAEQVTEGGVTQWWVAVDQNNDGTADYVYKLDVLAGSTLVAGDFHFV